MEFTTALNGSKFLALQTDFQIMKSDLDSGLEKNGLSSDKAVNDDLGAEDKVNGK